MTILAKQHKLQLTNTRLGDGKIMIQMIILVIVQENWRDKPILVGTLIIPLRTKSEWQHS